MRDIKIVYQHNKDGYRYKGRFRSNDPFDSTWSRHRSEWIISSGPTFKCEKMKWLLSKKHCGKHIGYRHRKGRVEQIQSCARVDCSFSRIMTVSVFFWFSKFWRFFEIFFKIIKMSWKNPQNLQNFLKILKNFQISIQNFEGFSKNLQKVLQKKTLLCMILSALP